MKAGRRERHLAGGEVPAETLRGHEPQPRAKPRAAVQGTARAQRPALRRRDCQRHRLRYVLDGRPTRYPGGVYVDSILCFWLYQRCCAVTRGEDVRAAELLGANLGGLSCKFKGCDEGVVGASIARDGGHVCQRHNVEEWAAALERNRDPYFHGLGVTLRQSLISITEPFTATPSQELSGGRCRETTP